MAAKIDFLWATDDVHPVSAGTWSGQPNKVQPPTTKQETGYQPEEAPSAEQFNYMLNKITLATRILESQRMFAGDIFKPIPSLAGENIVDAIFIDQADISGGAAVIRNQHWLLTASTLGRSEDGWSYVLAGTGLPASSIRLAYDMFHSGGKAVVIGGTQSDTTGSVPSDSSGTPDFSVTLGSQGHTRTVRDMVAHVNAAGDDGLILAVFDDGETNSYSGGDGANWGANVDTGTEDFVTLVSGNGILVASHEGDGLVVSDDDWATQTNVNLTAITAGVSEGYHPVWVEDPLPNPGKIADYDSALGLWVALGDDRLYTSVDSGVNWIDKSASCKLYTRSAGGASFSLAAAGFGGFTFETRTQIAATDGRRIFAIAYLNGVAELVIWSEDGLNWFDTGIRIPSGSTNTRLHSMIPPGGKGGGYVMLTGVGDGPMRTESVRTGVSPLTIDP